MRTVTLVTFIALAVFVVYYIAGDDAYDKGQETPCACEAPFSNVQGVNEGLLASRFENLEQLKSVIQIEYSAIPEDTADAKEAYSKVSLRHCSRGREVLSVLESGISQSDIMGVAGKGVMAKVELLLKSPFSIANRIDLFNIFSLARRKAPIFGAGDIAFYDLAETMVAHINTKDLAFKHPRDSSEKGYLNSFNHITAQAFITSCFSEEMADFLSDVHELSTMPELTTGLFTQQQLTDLNKNPVDNYIDMINNEWGQELGKKLKKKYQITSKTLWTRALLTNYLNDVQSYYSSSFQIGFAPYRQDEDLIIRFVDKINFIMQGNMPL